MQRVDLKTLFGTARPVIGMVHLRPLPGSPRAPRTAHIAASAGSSTMDGVIRAAVADARTLADGGVDAIIVENFGDAPFAPEVVQPITTACMTAAAAAVRAAVSVPLGINVLRNDAAAALAIAVAVGARFIRVNVHTGAMLTDQGWITGRAHDTLRLRASLGAANVAILADVMVKHAVPPAGLEIEDAARDTWHRGLADGLIVTGRATGAATSVDVLRRVRTAVPDAVLFTGSGAAPDTIASLMDVADGVIVGSALQQDGTAGNPVETKRVRRLLEALGR